jgi:cardiolipin synthase
MQSFLDLAHAVQVVMHRPFRGRSNLRNHRKSVVVDASKICSGGCNACRDLLSDANDRAWVDLSYNLCGPAVAVYRDVFHSDWSFATGCKPHTEDRFDCVADGNQRVQPIPSGPDVPCDALLNACLTAMFESDERIWIVTPYLVPPKSITDALCLAARRGVDVQVIVPKRSNHRLADWARGPHLREIQDADGRVFCHPKMVHAKTALFDSSLAMIGSANLDERSLLLNYELVLAMHSSLEIQSTRRWIEQLAAECQPWDAPSRRTRQIIESLAETVSPLL